MEKVAQALLVGAQKRIHLFDARDGEPGRAGQRQRRQPLRAAHRELGGNPAAERKSDQVHAVELQLFEQVEIEIGKVVNRIEPIRRVGFAEAGMFRRDNVEFLRKLLHERRPVRAGRPVQNNERAARAAAHQPDAAAPHRNHRRRTIRHALSMEIPVRRSRCAVRQICDHVIPGLLVARGPRATNGFKSCSNHRSIGQTSRQRRVFSQIVPARRSSVRASRAHGGSPRRRSSNNLPP